MPAYRENEMNNSPSTAVGGLSSYGDLPSFDEVANRIYGTTDVSTLPSFEEVSKQAFSGRYYNPVTRNSPKDADGLVNSNDTWTAPFGRIANSLAKTFGDNNATNYSRDAMRYDIQARELYDRAEAEQDINTRNQLIREANKLSDSADELMSKAKTALDWTEWLYQGEYAPNDSMGAQFLDNIGFSLKGLGTVLGAKALATAVAPQLAIPAMIAAGLYNVYSESGQEGTQAFDTLMRKGYDFEEADRRANVVQAGNAAGLLLTEPIQSMFLGGVLKTKNPLTGYLANIGSEAIEELWQDELSDYMTDTPRTWSDRARSAGGGAVNAAAMDAGARVAGAAANRIQQFNMDTFGRQIFGAPNVNGVNSALFEIINGNATPVVGTYGNADMVRTDAENGTLALDYLDDMNARADMNDAEGVVRRSVPTNSGLDLIMNAQGTQDIINGAHAEANAMNSAVNEFGSILGDYSATPQSAPTLPAQDAQRSMEVEMGTFGRGFVPEQPVQQTEAPNTGVSGALEQIGQPAETAAPAQTAETAQPKDDIRKRNEAQYAEWGEKDAVIRELNDKIAALESAGQKVPYELTRQRSGRLNELKRGIAHPQQTTAEAEQQTTAEQTEQPTATQETMQEAAPAPEPQSRRDAERDMKSREEDLDRRLELAENGRRMSEDLVRMDGLNIASLDEYMNGTKEGAKRSGRKYSREQSKAIRDKWKQILRGGSRGLPLDKFATMLHDAGMIADNYPQSAIDFLENGHFVTKKELNELYKERKALDAARTERNAQKKERLDRKRGQMSESLKDNYRHEPKRGMPEDLTANRNATDAEAEANFDDAMNFFSDMAKQDKQREEEKAETQNDTLPKTVREYMKERSPKADELEDIANKIEDRYGNRGGKEFHSLWFRIMNIRNKMVNRGEGAPIAHFHDRPMTEADYLHRKKMYAEYEAAMAEAKAVLDGRNAEAKAEAETTAETAEWKAKGGYERVRDNIRSAIESAKQRIYKKDDISAVAELYTSMMEAEARETGTSIEDVAARWNINFADEDAKIPAGSGDKVYHQFIGEKGAKALLTRMQSLTSAKKMEADGRSSDSIFWATGWYKNGSGKWAYDIDNSAFNFKRGIKDISLDVPYKLGDIFDAPELYKAYPKLADVSVVFSNKDSSNKYEDKRGKYKRNENTISMTVRTPQDKRITGREIAKHLLSSEFRDEYKHTLLHEIQHVIQNIEGVDFQDEANQYLYKDRPNEVEARRAAARSDLTETQRKILTPDIEGKHYSHHDTSDDMFRRWEELKKKIQDGTLDDVTPEELGKLRSMLEKAETEERGGNVIFKNDELNGAVTTFIQTLKNGDKSTLLHEAAHVWFEMRGRLMNDAGAKISEQAKADWETLNEWLNLDHNDNQSAQEKFAAGFEQYLAEGKAPSSRLERIFKTFKEWLTSIYGHIKNIKYRDSDGQLQEFTLSDEIRDVMDRIVGGSNGTETKTKTATAIKTVNNTVNENPNYAKWDFAYEDATQRKVGDIKVDSVSGRGINTIDVYAPNGKDDYSSLRLVSGDNSIAKYDSKTNTLTFREGVIISSKERNDIRHALSKSMGRLTNSKYNTAFDADTDTNLNRKRKGGLSLDAFRRSAEKAEEDGTVKSVAARQESARAQAADDADTEARMQEAFKGVKDEAGWKKTAEGIKKAIGNFHSEFPELSRDKTLYRAMESLRRRNSKSNSAIAFATESLEKSIGMLKTPEQYQLFTRKRVFDDLAEQLKTNPDARLPFGLTPETLASEREKITKLTESDKTVGKAIETEEAEIKRINDELIAVADKAGLKGMRAKLGRNHYFHHEVIAYAQAELAGDYMKARRGSSKDINLNYAQAMGTVRALMLRDIEMLRSLAEIKADYDRSADFKKGDAVPKGYVEFKPFSGKLIFSLGTVADHISAEAAEQIERIYGNVGEEIVQVVSGQEDTWIIPQGIADALNRIGKANTPAEIKRVAKMITNEWKNWTLNNPIHAPAYNLRNITGDSAAAFAGNIRTFLYAPRAIGELKDVYFRGKKASGELAEFQKRGGAALGNNASMLYDPAGSRAFKNLDTRTKGERAAEIAKHPLRSFMDAAKFISDFREQILRYATYLSYLDQMKKSKDGKTPDNWGASKREEVLAVDDARDRAFKMSNELIGAYDQVSVSGQEIRDSMMPFYAWLEVNSKRFGRLLANNPANVVGKFGAAYAMMYLFNNFFHKDEEEELPEDVRWRPHINLGKWGGKVRYFDRIGMMTDLLEWVNLDDYGAGVKQVLNGQLSVEDFLKDMALAVPKKMVDAMGPGLKTAVELRTNTDTYTGGRINQIDDHIMNTFGLRKVYRAMMGKRGEDLTLTDGFFNMFSSSAEGNRVAYSHIKQKVREYQERVLKRSTNASSTSPKSEAWRDMISAAEYGQKKKYNEARKRYIQAGGDLKSIKEAKKRLDPLSGLSKEDRVKFLRWLTPEERKLVTGSGRAMKHYYKVAARIN